MSRIHTFHKLSPVPIILIMLITGCDHTSNTVGEPASAVQAPSPALSVTAAAEPVDKPTVTAPAPPAAEVNPSDKVSLASAETSVKPEPAAPEDKAVPAKSKIDIRDPYNQAKPTLLGLNLNASVDNVTGRYGKPKEQFMMDEDSDPITVYDYSDFLVGFNNKKQLQFIDIRSADINPGLNGLKLGQTTADVFKALGNPDSNTSFVFTYKSTGAVLKLDVDPKTDKVNSIKLFSVES
jgi:hypothetical protein